MAAAKKYPTLRRISGALVFAIVTVGRASSAQQVTIDNSACLAMYQVLIAMHGHVDEQEISTQLDRTLATRPYRLMFGHYNRAWRPNELPPDVFRRMILSLRFPNEYHSGENARADTMLPRWKFYYDNPRLYARELEQLQRGDLRTRIRVGIRYAKQWLPPEWSIPAFYLAIIPNGGSPAFTFDGAQGYDFFQLAHETPGQIDWNWLLGTIAHESHHLGLQLKPPPGMSPRDILLFKAATLTMSEGAATYFISGSPPGLAPPLPHARFHVFTPELTIVWQQKLKQEQEMVDRQTALIDQAASGDLTQDGFESALREHWFAGLLGDGYVLGSEMFGAIYAAFGKPGVFEAMRHSLRFIVLYDKALLAKPELLKECRSFPPSIDALLKKNPQF